MDRTSHCKTAILSWPGQRSLDKGLRVPMWRDLSAGELCAVISGCIERKKGTKFWLQWVGGGLRRVLDQLAGAEEFTLESEADYQKRHDRETQNDYVGSGAAEADMRMLVGSSLRPARTLCSLRGKVLVEYYVQGGATSTGWSGLRILAQELGSSPARLATPHRARPICYWGLSYRWLLTLAECDVEWTGAPRGPRQAQAPGEYLQETISDKAKIVYSLYWDSGGPGAGADMEVVVKIHRDYWVKLSDDSEYRGPWTALVAALDANEALTMVGDATESVDCTEMSSQELSARVVNYADEGHSLTVNDTEVHL